MENQFIVSFYYGVADTAPAYRVLLNGVTSEKVKDITEIDLLGMIKEKGVATVALVAEDLMAIVEPFDNPELLDILSASNWEKINLEILSEEDHIPMTIVLSRSQEEGKIIAEFEGNRSGDAVTFKSRTGCFTTRLSRIESNLRVRTLLEVISQLGEYYGGVSSVSQIEEMFHAGIDDAVELVGRLFRGRVDLDGNPDILHVLSVGMAGRTVNEKLVGFLHDVVEDTGYTAEDLLRDGYSEEVVTAVLLLTRDESVPYMDYVKGIVESGNELAVAVKVNDLKHNIARGKAGGRHNHLVVMHEVALAYIEARLAA